MIKHLNNHEGMTLVEVVAALVLIGIVLISFFGLLIQSNKTTHKSNDIMDATYVAQMEMENLYNASGSASSYEDLASFYELSEEPGTSYSSLQDEYSPDETYTYLPREEGNFTYYLTLQTFAEGSTYENAVYVHLDVVENSSNSKATMENVYILGGAN
ncbi:hypothetical protein A0U40_13900 [[Bacillus] sp. KCTC 13219]|nr:hypothetical protein A0U40_13900 [[Bacillus] sp. KCTC 13219]